MANELPNAVALMRSADFRDWLTAAAAYQARVVVLEDVSTADHDIRLKLATDVLMTPSIVVDRLINAVATDPEVAVKGTTPELVTQAVILQKVAAVWTVLAKLSFPNG